MANPAPVERIQASAGTRRARPPCFGTVSGDVGDGVVSKGKARVRRPGLGRRRWRALHRLGRASRAFRYTALEAHPRALGTVAARGDRALATGAARDLAVERELCPHLSPRPRHRLKPSRSRVAEPGACVRLPECAQRAQDLPSRDLSVPNSCRNPRSNARSPPHARAAGLRCEQWADIVKRSTAKVD